MICSIDVWSLEKAANGISYSDQGRLETGVEQQEKKYYRFDAITDHNDQYEREVQRDLGNVEQRGLCKSAVHVDEVCDRPCHIDVHYIALRLQNVEVEDGKVRDWPLCVDKGSCIGWLKGE